MKNSLKPVIFSDSIYKRYQQNDFAQRVLMKAISTGVTDPVELKKLAGLKSVAEVYRTLDKMAIRKEYHEALARNGITLDMIVDGIKQICQTGKKDEVRLKAMEVLLRSLGLDKYDKAEESGRGWEEEILKLSEGKQNESGVLDVLPPASDNEDYEVNAPSVPDDEAVKKADERRLGKGLYDN